MFDSYLGHAFQVENTARPLTENYVKCPLLLSINLNLKLVPK